MKMKQLPQWMKNWSLIVALLLTFALVGCGGETTESDPVESDPVEETTDETAAEPDDSAAPTEPEEEQEIVIGLITKTETNPFFVKMKEGAQVKADEMGATLMTAAGTFDGDNEAQVTAIENMVAAGASAILITPSDTSAIVPAIENARAQDVMVIALDTPTEPQEATDRPYSVCV